jgi:Leucine-rich repeat (LRR) protein
MLGNFPLSPRLRTLLLARNRISSIQPSLANSIPNLTTLVLTSNNFAELADLDVLATFSNLTHLVPVGESGDEERGESPNPLGGNGWKRLLMGNY